MYLFVCESANTVSYANIDSENVEIHMTDEKSRVVCMGKIWKVPNNTFSLDPDAGMCVCVRVCMCTPTHNMVCGEESESSGRSCEPAARGRKYLIAHRIYVYTLHLYKNTEICVHSAFVYCTLLQTNWGAGVLGQKSIAIAGTLQLPKWNM